MIHLLSCDFFFLYNFLHDFFNENFTQFIFHVRFSQCFRFHVSHYLFKNKSHFDKYCVHIKHHGQMHLHTNLNTFVLFRSKSFSSNITKILWKETQPLVGLLSLTPASIYSQLLSFHFQTTVHAFTHTLMKTCIFC